MRQFLKKRHRKILLQATAIGFVTVALGVVFVAERKFSKLVVGGLGEQFSTRIIASPTFIRSRQTTGQIPLSLGSIVERLKRLNYVKRSAEPVTPGEYQIDRGMINIYLKGFETPYYNQSALNVSLSPLVPGWLITGESGNELEEIALEPEVASELSGVERIRREPATWEEIPVRLADAVVAVEDARFYRHWGISPRGILRAAWSNVSGEKVLQGGSTITQQLAKNLFLSSQRTIRRKIIEVFFAIYLEIRFSKERILTLYLNHIYMGQDGSTSVAGMRAAAQYYFGSPLSDLSLSECAMLAGIIRSPFRYNPFRDLKNSLERRDFVLKRMKTLGFITEKEFKEAIKEPVRLLAFHDTKSGQDDNAYFIAEVVRQLLPRYGEQEIHNTGLKIFTTLDPLLQKSAQASARKTKYQSALVALDPTTGYVRALVGGKSFKSSQFNRATQAVRQPGSAFKPFVYGAALENGMTPATLLSDKPQTFSDGKKGKWLPKNVGGKYLGEVTMRQALAMSLNSAAVDLVQKVGPETVVKFANRLGISSPIEKSLAVALGVSEVSLLELTAAYAPYNNEGYAVTPLLILAVQDADGESLETNGPSKHSVLDPALAFVMTSLLQSVVKEGTAQSLPLMGWPYPSAGKTGTTNEGRDAWFIGYTPELLVGAWVGDDEAKSIAVAGASHAMPLWASVMVNAYRGTHPSEFQQPAGIISLKIDPLSGKTTRSGCPKPAMEIFIKGTEPMEPCPLHQGGVKGFFQKLFN